MEYKKFVIIIPSYNNAKWYERNLLSAMGQDYPEENYRVIYKNDASTDRTGNLVGELIAKNGWKNIELINNTERKGALHNIYDMVHSCEDTDICALLDGDDMYTSGILKRLNLKFQDENVWATYGSYADSNGMTRGCCKPPNPMVVQKAAYRKVPWYMSHSRVFYSKLFKQIKWEDLLYYDGTPFKMAWDMALMIPMAEMAAERMHYIHEINYIYNNDNDISDYKVDQGLQGRMDQYIRNKKPYERLGKLW